MRTSRLAPVALAALVVSTASAPAATVEVFVFSFEYSTNRPGQGPVLDPTIGLGDTVRWTFLTLGHSVTSVDGIPESFDSGVLFAQPPAPFEHTFAHTGTFHYYCRPHGVDRGDGTAAGMSGTVTVVPSPGPGALLALSAGALARRRRR